VERKVYCDHAATSPAFPEVITGMAECMTNIIGNPSSIHSFGRAAKERLENARGQVADLIGAFPEEVFFTSGGTEADNLAIFGTMARFPEGGHLITTPIEHAAVLETSQYLAEHGYDVTYLPVDTEGRVNAEDVKKALRPDTRLISVMHVNNEVGTIQPVEEIAAIAQEAGVACHIDAVQSLGRIEVDVNKIGCDFMTISSHKINGPKGVGVLYCKNGSKLVRRAYGGGQEHKLRSGTENLPGIVGMGIAASITKEIWQERAAANRLMRDHLLDRILKEIPYSYVNGSLTYRVPHNLHVSFSYIEGEALLLHLDMKGIAVSSGSACSSGSGEPSHVLKAMRLPAERLQAALRITIGQGNTMEDMDYVADMMAAKVGLLRQLSPFMPRDLK
jgi:cysteine desulfurase